MKHEPHTPVKFPLSPEEQLHQLGEQYKYLQRNIDESETEAELDAYADIEHAIEHRIGELAAELAGQHSKPEDDDVIDLVTLEKFADTFGDQESISGLEKVYFTDKRGKQAISAKAKDLESVEALRVGGDEEIELDNFEITTDNGAVFRLSDLSPHLSAQARDPFVSENPEGFKEQALRTLLQDLILYSANGYTQPLHNVKGSPEVKYVKHGTLRAYFVIASGELNETAKENGAIEPDRHFIYIGSCSKNKEAELYSELFGVKMKV